MKSNKKLRSTFKGPKISSLCFIYYYDFAGFNMFELVELAFLPDRCVERVAYICRMCSRPIGWLVGWLAGGHSRRRESTNLIVCLHYINPAVCAAVHLGSNCDFLRAPYARLITNLSTGFSIIQ